MDNDRKDRMITDEQIAPRFARLLLDAALTHGAPSFAADIAEKGATPENLRLMASRWSEPGFEFEPPEFADELCAFADELEDN